MISRLKLSKVTLRISGIPSNRSKKVFLGYLATIQISSVYVIGFYFSDIGFGCNDTITEIIMFWFLLALYTIFKLIVRAHQRKDPNI